MKEKTIKDIIEKGRWNWYGEGDESQDESCYQGKFWDHTANKFVRWHELTKEDSSK